VLTWLAWEEVPLILLFLFALPYFAEITVLTLMSRRSSIRRKTNTMRKHPFISVIVATHNEERNVNAKIQNLLEQKYPRDLMEIVFVDSSTDRTGDYIMSWQSEVPGIRLITEERRMGLAHALNLGYSTAKGEIVVKSDCDIIHEPSSLDNLVANFDDARVGRSQAGRFFCMRTAQSSDTEACSIGNGSSKADSAPQIFLRRFVRFARTWYSKSAKGLWLMRQS